MNMITDKVLIQRVEDALDQMRPFLERDGGDVELIGITDEMVVQVKFLGACLTCDMSAMTLKAGLEEAVKRAVPEVNAVTALSGFEKPELADV